MRILGIDPGYERLGVAVVEKKGGKEVVIFSDCIITSRELPHPERLEQITLSVGSLIDEYKPDVVAVETLFFNDNRKTAMKVSEARGACLSEASRKGIVVEEYTPLEVKIAITGYGRADKRQVSEMVRRIVNVKKIPKYDDEYDALAVALTCTASKQSQ